MASDSFKSTSINKAEHVSTTDGENIDAKRVAPYGYDYANNEWRRLRVGSGGNLEATVETVDYDKQLSYTATTDIIEYQLDSVTVKTLTVTYTNSTKEVIDSVVWS